MKNRLLLVISQGCHPENTVCSTCPKNPPGLFGIIGQRAGFCQIYLTGLGSRKSCRQDLLKKSQVDFLDKLSASGILPNLLNRIGISKSCGQDLPEQSALDFWDKWSADGILPNLLYRIDIPNTPCAGFARKTRQGFLG